MVLGLVLETRIIRNGLVEVKHESTSTEVLYESSEVKYIFVIERCLSH